MCTDRRQRGVTLIELIVFIVIVSVGLAGILSVLNLTTRHSADPMIRKQMLAIAEGLMDEVAAQPVTWCDPDDPAAATAMNVAACATPEAIGAEGGETRGGAVTPFDNVNDYNGLAGITTGITGTAMPLGYSAAITVAQDALGPGGAVVPAAAALRMTVTVSFGNENLVVEGYRTRYAPNALP
ncbi:MAG: prepilin-type N-terminal cleavage/methylation domain-containing protein [Rhodocyclales bacterium]|nr:prepilin-type N-terminal cleavage/methylation domain-containing protein [Rhodocyclales bacterium]